MGLQWYQKPTYLCKSAHAQGGGLHPTHIAPGPTGMVLIFPATTSLSFHSGLQLYLYQLLKKKKKQKPDSEFIYSGVNPELLLGIQYIYPLPTQLQTLSSRS